MPYLSSKENQTHKLPFTDPYRDESPYQTMLKLGTWAQSVTYGLWLAKQRSTIDTPGWRSSLYRLLGALCLNRASVQTHESILGIHSSLATDNTHARCEVRSHTNHLPSCFRLESISWPGSYAANAVGPGMQS